MVENMSNERLHEIADDQGDEDGFFDIPDPSEWKSMARELIELRSERDRLLGALEKIKAEFEYVARIGGWPEWRQALEHAHASAESTLTDSRASTGRIPRQRDNEAGRDD